MGGELKGAGVGATGTVGAQEEVGDRVPVAPHVGTVRVDAPSEHLDVSQCVGEARVLSSKDQVVIGEIDKHPVMARHERRLVRMGAHARMAQGLQGRADDGDRVGNVESQ